MSRSQIEDRYGVPLAIDVLWRELECYLDPEHIAALREVYRRASQRYGRASRLNDMRRQLAHWERMGWPQAKSEKAARYREALADPKQYIDGGSDE